METAMTSLSGAESKLDEKKIAFLKALLLQQLEDYTRRGDDAVSGMKEEDNFYADPLDRASSETVRDFSLRIKDRESQLIKKIKNALEKIEEGTYGICETCEEEISFDRLKARPVAMHCIECKTKSEYLEKFFKE